MDWVADIDTARSIEGVSAHHISDAELLGLLEVESGGDPQAHRAGAPYRGALQIGPSMTRYMWEADTASRMMLHEAWTLDDEARAGIPDATVFHGQRILTLRFYLRAQRRLEPLHRGGIVGRWLVWKAGIRAAVQYFKVERQRGERAARRWLGAQDRLGRPLEYLRRVKEATARYQTLIDQHNAPHGVCAPKLLLVPRFEWFFEPPARA